MTKRIAAADSTAQSEMRRKDFVKALDYVPPVVAFVAATAAVVGAQRWDSTAVGLLKITPSGWMVLVIGAMALVASLLVTSRNKREQAQQRRTKERIASIGAAQLLRALNHSIHPISSSSIWREKCPSPESPIDMLSAERRKILAELNLNSASPYKDGSFEEIRWYSMLERAALEGSKEITTTLQIYASYFSPEMMDALTKVLYSDFLGHRLSRIHDIVLANTHRDPERPVPFFWVDDDRMHSADYEEFWRLMTHAMVLCGAPMTLGGQPKFGYA